jgi:hypothetical protein
MVLFFTSTLCLSVLAMVALLAVKRYELVSGRVLFSGVRPAVNSFFGQVSQWGQKILPELLRHYMERAAQFVLKKTQLGVAQIIVTFEHALESVLSAVRERTEDLHPSREPSAFLREVADHKKNLLYKKRSLKKPKLKNTETRDTVQE